MKPTAKEVRIPEIIATALISVTKRAGILIKDAPAIIGIERAKEKIAASFLALGYRGSGHGQIKKPPDGGLPPFFFTVSAVTYRPLLGAGFGTFKKDSKVAVRLRASSLAATLDSPGYILLLRF